MSSELTVAEPAAKRQKQERHEESGAGVLSEKSPPEDKGHGKADGEGRLEQLTVKRILPKTAAARREYEAFSEEWTAMVNKKAVEFEYAHIDPSASKGAEGKAGEGSGEAAGNDKAEEDPTLYCICRQRAHPSDLMIACDLCDDWYHAKCVGLTRYQCEKLIDKWFCAKCLGEPPPFVVHHHCRIRFAFADRLAFLDCLSIHAAKGAKAMVLKVCCRAPGCMEAPRDGSKYCSYACGMEWARQYLIEQSREQQRLQSLAPLSETSPADQMLMDSLREKLQESENRLNRIRELASINADSCGWDGCTEPRRCTIHAGWRASKTREAELNREHIVRAVLFFFFSSIGFFHCFD
jgi:hypothetical protein